MNIRSLFALFALFVVTATAQQTPIKNGLLTGTLNGTPTGGTLNLSGLTLTLPTSALQIGTGVQAYDADLAAIASLSTATAGRSLLTLSAVPASALVGISDTQTLTAKTINGDSNTISNASNIAIYRRTKANRSNGDAISATTWTKMTLNDEQADSNGGYSVASDVITVASAGAGERWIFAQAQFYQTGSAQFRLRRTNNTAATLAVSSVVYSWSGTAVSAGALILAKVTLSAGDTLELQAWTQSGGYIGTDSAYGNSDEIYVSTLLQIETR